MKTNSYILSTLGLAVALAATTGCSLCCGPDDFNYGTYGGLHPRADMQHGRVGSVFSDPSGTALNLVPYGEQPAEEGEQGGAGIQPEPLEKNDLPKPGGNDKKNAYYQGQPAGQVGKPPRRLRTGINKTRSARKNRSFLGGSRLR